MIESFFSDYIFNDTIFSLRYLWLFCLCVIFCIISLWLCYRKSHKCQNIDFWYFLLICISLINYLKMDYRTSIFMLALIAQFGIYLFVRLSNIQVSKWIKPKIYIFSASFLVFTNIIVALVIT